MKKINIWVLIVTVLVVVNSAALVMLWKHGGHRFRPMPEQHAEVKDFIIKELALTPVQTKQFDDLRKAHSHTIDSLNENTRMLKDRLFASLGKPAISSKTIDSITGKIGDDAAMIDGATFYHFQKLRGILNADQQKKFDSIIRQVLHMMAHNPAGPAPGRPRGPGGMQQGPPPPGGPDGNQAGPPPGGGGPSN
jgi:hypothetical protein